jgi:hypothetical protein
MGSLSRPSFLPASIYYTRTRDCSRNVHVISDPDLRTLENPAADTSAPFGREGSFEALMRCVHQMTGMGLLGDFQHQISNPQLPALLGGCDPLDEEIGPAHHPRKGDAKLAAGAFPALPEKDRDLPAGFSATGVSLDAIGTPNFHLLDLDQGGPKGWGTGYSQQNSHIFTSTILQLVMNYTFMS